MNPEASPAEATAQGLAMVDPSQRGVVERSTFAPAYQAALLEVPLANLKAVEEAARLGELAALKEAAKEHMMSAFDSLDDDNDQRVGILNYPLLASALHPFGISEMAINAEDHYL